MRKTIIGLAAGLAMAASAPVAAGEHRERLAGCLKESSTQADRDALVRWIFVAMSAHPLTADLAAVPADTASAVSRDASSVFAKLITETCGAESAGTIKYEGTEAFGKAFEVLGMFAMDGLMGHPNVAAAVDEMSSHLDPAQFDAMMQRHGN